MKGCIVITGPGKRGGQSARRKRKDSEKKGDGSFLKNSTSFRASLRRIVLWSRRGRRRGRRICKFRLTRGFPNVSAVPRFLSPRGSSSRMLNFVESKEERIYRAQEGSVV